MVRTAGVLAWAVGLGFGLPCVFAIWHFANHGDVWTLMGLPTYGRRSRIATAGRPPSHQVRIEVGDGRPPDQGHRPLHVGGKQPQNAVNTPLASGSKAV
jgi:hypothetical protein